MCPAEQGEEERPPPLQEHSGDFSVQADAWRWQLSGSTLWCYGKHRAAHIAEPMAPLLRPVVLRKSTQGKPASLQQVPKSRCKAPAPALGKTTCGPQQSPAGLTVAEPSQKAITRNRSSFSSQRWSSSISCCCRISRSSIRWGGSTCPRPRRSSVAESWTGYKPHSCS